MSQKSFSSLNEALLVRDSQGRYIPASVDQILDAARLAIERKVERGAQFTSPAVVKEYLSNKLAGYEYEVFAVLFLDNLNRLIEYVEMFRGNHNCTTVHPREVVKEALRLNAAAVIFSHNHPSGCAEPSRADEEVTRRLREALALLDVRTLDHLVVAGGDVVSFAERGLI